MAVRETQEGYDARAGMLTPVAYLWTRTVRCKNPACGGTVPLARQTWLARKKAGKTSPGHCIALKAHTKCNHDSSSNEKKVRYEVVKAKTREGLGFNPSSGSRRGNVPCPFCGTVADRDYVKAEGQAGRIGSQPMAIVSTLPGERGKVYLAPDEVPSTVWPDESLIQERIRVLEKETGHGSQRLAMRRLVP
jgi:putative DNA methylase